MSARRLIVAALLVALTSCLSAEAPPTSAERAPMEAQAPPPSTPMQWGGARGPAASAEPPEPGFDDKPMEAPKAEPSPTPTTPMPVTAKPARAKLGADFGQGSTVLNAPAVDVPTGAYRAELKKSKEEAPPPPPADPALGNRRNLAGLPESTLEAAEKSVAEKSRNQRGPGESGLMGAERGGQADRLGSAAGMGLRGLEKRVEADGFELVDGKLKVRESSGVKSAPEAGLLLGKKGYVAAGQEAPDRNADGLVDVSDVVSDDGEIDEVAKSKAKPKAPPASGEGEETELEEKNLAAATVTDEETAAPDDQPSLAGDARKQDRGGLERDGKEQLARRGGRDSTRTLHAGGEVDGRFFTRQGEEESKREAALEEQLRQTPPERFLPRVAYFENTYLGGNAAFARRTRLLDLALGGGDRAYDDAHAPSQPFDAPESGGIAVTATLDQTWLEKPGRVYLQVGLQGSKRFGWRRPPLDLVAVIDAAVLADEPERVTELAATLLRHLEPTDRIGLVVAGPTPRVVMEPTAPRDLRATLARQLEGFKAPAVGGPESVAAALTEAGALLATASGNTARVPGTQTVMLLARAGDADRARAAAPAAHALTVQGAVTSVVEVGYDAGSQWWAVADAGYGNLHEVAPAAGTEGVVQAELSALSKVVARLVRVNIKLGPKTQPIRILGARVLGQEEVKEVKSREEATDRNLSKTMGVAADRGADDDGLQTVIPYFYGGDSHVILVELWVEGPGAIAEVSVKYKDMVALSNGSARAAASMSAVPRPTTAAEQIVRVNRRGFEQAVAMLAAGDALERGETGGARALLTQAPAGAGGDARLAGLRALVDRTDAGALASSVAAEAMRVAGARQIGLPAD